MKNWDDKSENASHEISINMTGGKTDENVHFKALNVELQAMTSQQRQLQQQ